MVINRVKGSAHQSSDPHLCFQKLTVAEDHAVRWERRVDGFSGYRKHNVNIRQLLLLPQAREGKTLTTLH